jgi:hypothetical protein
MAFEDKTRPLLAGGQAPALAFGSESYVLTRYGGSLQALCYCGPGSLGYGESTTSDKAARLDST